MIASVSATRWGRDVATLRSQLLSDGFVRLADAIPTDLLDRWRTLADQIERTALDERAAGRVTAHACVIDTDDGPSLIRRDDLHAVDHDAVIDLLACPAMMFVAREFCGRGTVPLQVDLVVKQSGPSSTILWHQGAPHPRSYPYLNIGIYLDDADAGDGCVRYVPGTQHELEDIAALTEAHGWDLPGSVEVPARAGDIIVQDMMVLHASPPKQTARVRRTVYVELRPVAGIDESGAQSVEWAELRRRFMAIVVRRAGVAAWPAGWSVDLPVGLGTDRDEIAALLARHEAPIPAVYAGRPVDHPRYP